MFGGRFFRASGSINNLSTGNFGGAGGVYELYGVDLTDTNSTLFANVGSNYVSDDKMTITMDLCQLSSAVDTSDLYFNEDFAKPLHKISITRCSSSSSDAEHRFYSKLYVGLSPTILRSTGMALPPLKIQIKGFAESCYQYKQ